MMMVMKSRFDVTVVDRASGEVSRFSADAMEHKRNIHSESGRDYVVSSDVKMFGVGELRQRYAPGMSDMTEPDLL